MKPLFNISELSNFKPGTMLQFECEYCSSTFVEPIKYVKYNIKTNKIRSNYCSTICRDKANTKLITKQCMFCGKECSRQLNQFKKSKTGNIFCNSSCSAKYSNTHKTTGTRVSKFEVWLQTKLSSDFPNINFLFNKLDLRRELDVYIPELKLAIEINGIHHYRPIYGEDKLQRIQQLDLEKQQLCEQLGVNLIVVDISKQSIFTEESSLPFYSIIKEAIECLIC